jgi:glyoxylase-like metal-dependent hydrolase (beta-lactamase superfamily II)
MRAAIDLYRRAERIITVYVVDTDDGLGLVDCGPSSCFAELEAGLAANGLAVKDVRHLLLTHIHLDHAGAAGVLARENAELQIHVSEIGAPHLVDPSRLEASARRLYGDAFDGLWGELAAVPEGRVLAVRDAVLGFECFASPGHARHQISYLGGDGTLYPGDSLGMRVAPARFVVSITPPPEVDLEAWESTLGETERRTPARLALPHFGVFDDVEEHVAGFRETLHRWSDRVAGGVDEPTFVALARGDCAASDPREVAEYDRSDPWWSCYRGLERYWQKARAAAAS